MVSEIHSRRDDDRSRGGQDRPSCSEGGRRLVIARP
jgi:hypothetical protein